MEILTNQVAPPSAPPNLAELAGRVRDFLRREAGFAQVFTINREGYPVGRTMGAPVDDDFTVWLIQRKVHRRIGQWRRNPRTEVLWVGTPAPDSRNDHPHVYDFNLLVPRAVFIRGDAEFVDEGTTLQVYLRQSAMHRARGWTRAPERSAENVAAELVGVRIRPKHIRVEGFGEGAESFTWHP
jgi:Pyridoxamine 5'-phosphate oxidase